MMKFYTKLALCLFLLLGLAVGSNAQPWTYDFGTGTGVANNSNSGSGNTSFFSDTPLGGGTYRVRIGSGGGNLSLLNPGTTLGSNTEAQLIATTGASSNKFTIYGWDSPSPSAYLKFKIRTTSTGNGTLVIHLGNGSALFSDNNGYTNYNNSIATLVITYSSGNLSVTRRVSGSFSSVMDHGISKDTDQEFEIYANNSASISSYTRSGSNSLNAQSWDLWVDGVKVSPNGGWPKAGTMNPGVNLAGIGFFGESSTSNAARIILDDLEYSNSLPTACTAPTESPEEFATFSTANENSIDLEWLDGNGAGRVIKMNTTNSFTNLSSGADPTASTVYTSGEQVIFNDSNSSLITITGLLPNTTYYFKGYEYCSPDRVYNNSGTAESITTDIGDNIILTDAASFGPFCTGSNHSISVGFDSDGDFNENFKVQLSNASGVFSINLNDNIIGSGSTSPISASIPSSIPAGSGYRVRVINSDPITIGDDNGSDIVLNATPTIPTSTVPAAVCAGNSISITASGSSASTYTFWDSNTGGNQITTGISGNTLTLDNSTSSGNYTYYIQAENGTCVSDRQEVTLIINSVPDVPLDEFSISNNPSCGPATIGYEDGYYFQTSATGTSFSFPTSSDYVLNSTGILYVRAFDGNCWSGALASESISIVAPIQITSQPSNVSISANGSGSLSVTASNVSSYQWQVNDGNGWDDIASANSSSLTISNPPISSNGYQYRVVLTPNNAACSTLVSNAATLTVTPPVAGTIWSDIIEGTNPGNQNPFNSANQNDFYINSNLTVSGISRSANISPNDGNNRYNTTGWSSPIDTSKYIYWTIEANSGYTFSITELDLNVQKSNTGPTSYQLRTSLDNFTSISYSGTFSSNSGSATVVLNTDELTEIEVRIYAIGSSGTFSVNDFDFKGFVNVAETCDIPAPANDFTYSANPSCGPMTVSYPAGYYFQTSATDTSTNYPTSSPFVVSSTRKIYVRELDGTCWSEAVESDNIVVRNPIVISSQPQNKTISSTGSGSISVTASNVTSYQWQVNDGSGWSNINGSTTPILNFNNPSESTSGYQYRVVLIGNTPCSNVTSNAVTVNVVSPSSPCDTPANLNTFVSGNQVTFDWNNTSADIFVVMLKDASTGQNSKAYCPTSAPFTVTVPSGTYTWSVASLCNTDIFITGHGSGFVNGTQFTVP